MCAHALFFKRFNRTRLTLSAVRFLIRFDSIRFLNPSFSVYDVSSYFCCCCCCCNHCFPKATETTWMIWHTCMHVCTKERHREQFSLCYHWIQLNVFSFQSVHWRKMETKGEFPFFKVVELLLSFISHFRSCDSFFLWFCITFSTFHFAHFVSVTRNKGTVSVLLFGKCGTFIRR